MNIPKTYSQIYIQLVFAVSKRESLIQKNWKDDLNKYISGIITNNDQKSIIVNGMPEYPYFLRFEAFYGDIWFGEGSQKKFYQFHKRVRVFEA